MATAQMTDKEWDAMVAERYQAMRGKCFSQSREWWEYTRLRYYPYERPDLNVSRAVESYATPDEIAIMLAGAERAWRDMGPVVKRLNQEAPERTCKAQRTMAREQQDKVNAALWAASDRRCVRKVCDSLRGIGPDNLLRRLDHEAELIGGEAAAETAKVPGFDRWRPS